jgi:hypothetical protein
MADVPRFTAEQETLWGLVQGDGPATPSGDQTAEQARHMAISDFQMICELEGLPIPSDDTVAARLDG